VTENLEYAAAVHGIVGEDNFDWTSRLIARHGLTLYKDRTWSELSAGFRMRFDLALARISRPRLLILDEPLGNLDIVSQQSFLFDLTQLVKTSTETSIVITSQHLFEIEAIADEIVLLAGGRRVAPMVPAQAHFEAWWSRSANPSEEFISRAFASFEPITVKMGTTSCLISLKQGTTLDHLVATAGENGLTLAYARDVTNSVLVDMHRVAALSEN
jgi:ABC-2 type transport system ATP-binding protein